MTHLSLPGIMTARQARQTADHIAAHQVRSGQIPWFAGQHSDPWDHVEAAMALAATGLHAEARRAYEWSAETQAADGTWPMRWTSTEDAGGEKSQTVDTNQCGYLAVGVWHYWLVTGDRTFAVAMWPTVRRAIDFVCDMQQLDGTLCWARDPSGSPDRQALLTGSSCAVLALRCAVALGELLGDPQPAWEIAAGRLAHAVADHPERFADRARFAMDWYYPVLGGAVRGTAARRRLDDAWSRFVVPGRGVRCVSDRPWITVAETCELVLTLDAIGSPRAAARLLRDVQFCRADEGGYWTGWVWPDEVFWPEEQTTWTSAAVILAADAIAEHSGGHAIFRGNLLPPTWQMTECDEQCSAETSRLIGEQ